MQLVIEFSYYTTLDQMVRHTKEVARLKERGNPGFLEMLKCEKF